MEVSEACGRLLPASLRPLARRQLVRVRYLGLRTADALLVSYPASGSTWLRFLLAHALTGVEPDFDSIRTTVPPVGRHRRAPELLPGSGRVVRTHEPLGPERPGQSGRLGPERPPRSGKREHHRARPGQPVLYLVRDGRDVALSYFEHLRREGRFPGDLAQFVDRFVMGDLDGYGPWADHVTAAVEFGRSGSGPFLLLRYEDLRSTPERELGRALDFLGRPADHATVAAVVAAHTKQRMRSKEGTSRFLAGRHSDGTPVVRPERRQGWVDLVPAESRARFDQACRAALEAAGYAV